MESALSGWLMIIVGLVVAVFGARAFRLGLGIAGFAAGFLLAFLLLGDVGSINHILISLVGGAIGAGLALALVKWSVYFAGALLGLAIALAIISATGLSGSDGVTGVIGLVLALAGLIGGGLIGPFLGTNALLLASAGLGSLLIVGGFQTAFAPEIGGAEAGKVLSGPFTVSLFIVLFLLAALGQVDLGGFGGPKKTARP